MKKISKKDFFKNEEPIAYYINMNYLKTYAIYFISYGINDYVYYTSYTNKEGTRYHKSKIYRNNIGPYIKCDGIRLKLNEFIKF